MRAALVRYHEIALKRGNRAWFVEHLKKNLSTALRGMGLKEIRNASGRLLLNFNHDVPPEEVAGRLGRVFGIANFSLVERTDADMPALEAHVLEALEGQSFDSFRVETRRVDKRFPLTSNDINRKLGALVQAHSGARVDLNRPELTVSVEVLPSNAFVSLERTPGPGGLPVGASGRLVSLISGGIDSPVASYRMMQRGCRLMFVHFHSSPFLDRSSQDKSRALVEMLTRYQYLSRLHLVPFGEIQRRIVAAVLRPLRVVIYRRMMLRIASAIAAKERARALVTGESLAQVASQTLPNIAVIEEAARLPVLRPLIGMDKQEIIDQATAIGTFETSVLPDQDCCQLFVPKHPAIKATLRRVREAEAALDVDELVGLGVDHAEIERFYFPEPKRSDTPKVARTGHAQMTSIRSFIRDTWQASIVPALKEYIAIPNESPAFDPRWREHGHMDRAVELFTGWAAVQNIPGLELHVARAEGRTPLLLMEIPGTGRGTVLLYGHLDKQPPMEGWRPGLGPWTPVLEDGRLYGRGGADDGYGMFAALTAVKALKLESIPCARCVVMIEACEESGSFDLPHYVDALADRIGTPDLVVCLDSGCGDYERMWVTTSLRGVINATLSVSTLTEGVHSGAASGIVPSSFRILRRLLSRLEDEDTGEVLPRALHVDIPPDRLAQAGAAAEVLGASLHEGYPFHPGAVPVADDIAELLLNRAWRPQLEIIGAAGLPALEQAGNVLRPETVAKLSLRLPPTAGPDAAVACLRDTLTRDPPYGARVAFDPGQGTGGWNAPPFAPWLEESMNRASHEFFGKDACATGEGGTIPFMAMLAEKFPEAQFMITGVLGPKSNAHGPNEFLHIETAMNLTGCVARVLQDHYRAANAL